jgi:transposase
MAKPLVSDDLWELIAPILPKRARSRKGGRPALGDRKVLTGIIFVLKTGIPWEALPQEMGCGCGMSCWRRLRDWQAAGVWERLHLLLLDGLQGAEAIDWSRALIDSASVRAIGGGQKPAPAPRIDANRGASTTWSPMRKASRWHVRSRRPIAMTSRS